MADKEITKLRELAQLEVDAIGLYEAAIERIDVPLISERLSEFRVDHQRHAEDLNTAIVRLGGIELPSSPDLKGTVLRGFTSVTSMMGNQAALLGMMGNEELTKKSYESALRVDWATDLRALIEKSCGDEKRHLAWIKQALKDKYWEVGASAHPHS